MSEGSSEAWSELADFIIHKNSIDLGGRWVWTKLLINCSIWQQEHRLNLQFSVGKLMFFSRKFQFSPNQKLIFTLKHWLYFVWMHSFIIYIAGLVEMIILNQVAVPSMDGCRCRIWVEILVKLVKPTRENREKWSILYKISQILNLFLKG